jgi:hypothetical protein
MMPGRNPVTGSAHQGTDYRRHLDWRWPILQLWSLIPGKGSAVKDYQASVEKLRKEAAEAALISDLATDPVKRETFNTLSRHLTVLADQVEQAMSKPDGA